MSVGRYKILLNSTAQYNGRCLFQNNQYLLLTRIVISDQAKLSEGRCEMGSSDSLQLVLKKVYVNQDI